MPWQCRLVDIAKQPKAIGDMWFGEALPITNEPGRYMDIPSGDLLSDEYIRERMAKRKPLDVMMPNGDVFCIDAAVSGERRGWNVSGDPPRITVKPSINIIGRYHGFVTDGVISDDVDGRKFGQ
jgi:hypothetical protein